MDSEGDHTPYLKITLRRHLYRLKIRIVRNEPCACAGGIEAKLLDGIFAIDVRYDIIAVLGLQTAVHDHDVAVQDTGISFPDEASSLARG